MNDIDAIFNHLISTGTPPSPDTIQTVAPTEREHLVRWLIDALGHMQVEVRRHAFEALIHCGVHAIDPLIEALESPHQPVRLYAVRALGKLSDPRATAPLTELLYHASRELAFEIAEALAYLDDDETIPPLMDILRSEDPEARSIALRGIVKQGAAALPHLTHALSNNSWVTRSMAAKALGLIQDHRAIEPLIETLHDPDSSVCIAVVHALAKFPADHVLKPIAGMLRHDHQPVRLSTVEALGQLGDSRAIPSLIDALTYEEWSKRAPILQSLATLGRQETALLIEGLSSENPRLRIGLTEVFQILNVPEAVEPLIDRLDEFNPETRLAAIKALRAQEDTRIYSVFIKQLADNHHLVSKEAGDAISSVYPASKPHLMHALIHKKPVIRIRAAAILSELHPEKSIDRPLLIGKRATPFLLDALLHTREDRGPLVRMLRSVKGDTLAHTMGLIYSGHSQFMYLVDMLRESGEWRHVSLLLHDFESLAHVLTERDRQTLKRSIKKTVTENQRPLNKTGLCTVHYSRFTKHDHPNGIDYFGCRECTSTLFGIEAPHVSLLFDTSFEYLLSHVGDTCKINGLHIDPTIDFDEIVIGPCPDERIVAACMMLGNDTDPVRIKKYRKATCRLNSDASVSEQTKNLLRQRFRRVIHEERSGEL